MKTLKTWMTAGLCAGALLSGAAALAQEAGRGPAAFPAPGSPTIYKSAGELDKVFQEELAKKGATTESRAQLTDRTSFTLVRRDQPNPPIAHQGWTELHYIVDGDGVIEVGGSPQKGADGSATLTGAVSKHVSKGDIVIIPASTQHHYKALDGHVTYYEMRFPDAVGTAAAGAPPAAPAPAAGSPGIFFSADELAANLAKAVKANSAVAVAPVLVTDRYSITQVQRGAPAQAAVHVGWNEMHYILGGKGTLTTGGKTTGAGATLAVEGGVSQVMSPGDVMIVPDSTPHQYTAMSPHVTYLEVRFPNVVGERAPPPPR